MKIYTSYFANYRNFPDNALALGITRFPPNYWDGINIANFAPSEKLLRQYRNKDIDEFMFKNLYLEEINSKYSREDVLNIFDLLSTGGKFDIILCCYEKPNEFCHRHILAEWLGDVKELES